MVRELTDRQEKMCAQIEKYNLGSLHFSKPSAFKCVKLLATIIFFYSILCIQFYKNCSMVLERNIKPAFSLTHTYVLDNSARVSLSLAEIVFIPIAQQTFQFSFQVAWHDFKIHLIYILLCDKITR